MNFHYLKSLSAVALAGIFAVNAYAETLSQEFVIDFAEKEVGFKLNSFWGGPNDHMAVVATDEGNLLLVDGVTVNEETGEPAVNEAGYPSWNTKTRYEGLSLPSGFNFGNVLLIEVVYKPTQPDNVPFAIQLRNLTDPLNYEGEVVVGEWNTLAFDPAEFTTGEGSDAYTGSPTSFDFCMGADGSSNYYIKSVTFYLEKEVTQREKDEAALNKETAACFEFNFDNWPVSGDVDGAFSSPYVGSNGGGVNRPDMVIDLGPDDYNNNCAHVIYGGHTNIFVTEPVIVPEGYTFDDLRLIEYDVFVTDLPGVDYTNGDEFTGARQVPALKLKDGYPWGWEPVGGEGTRASTPVPPVGEWSKVEFYPSTFAWVAREVDVPVLDENGEPVVDDEGNQVTEKVAQDEETVAAEFGKKTQFWMSFGFRPCENQCYVDNIKLWFQKGGEDAVESISAVKANDVIYNIYGQKVDDNYRGIVIKNGKKYINK